VTTLPVQEDDILILAGDGLSNDMGNEGVLRTVQQVRRAFMPHPDASVLGRRTLISMLNKALCLRARGIATDEVTSTPSDLDDVFDAPFARRARRSGKLFQFEKMDGAYLSSSPPTHPC
jgi:serine/threonine protein phosphatase PrpC